MLIWSTVLGLEDRRERRDAIELDGRRERARFFGSVSR